MMQLHPVTFDDWALLLAWRNDEETRKNSHTTDLVSEEGHKTWLKASIENPNRQLFLAKEGDEPVGTTRSDFDPEHAVYTLSWAVAPTARGRGIGKRMVRLLVEQLGAVKIRAEVKEENVSSSKIALHAGLQLTETIDGVQIYMNNLPSD
ncbi:MAG TPA: N-acetyltransferase [Cytophagales bacterium]|nr:N-acetyltransferase [Cytophagales bacterium]HAA18398.1 N-acetyltransferase [Cytophagales bacterium]